MNFREEYTEKKNQIEEILKEFLPPQEGYQKIIMEAMEYSLMAGGKRLRPMLMMETFHLFGGQGAAIRPFMAAIEMIHTYSLVHDDLPAMDNDEYRRGRKTTHVVYGEDMGILAGDALLNYAFETACQAFDREPQQSERIGRALRILAKKAGIYGMIGGQVVDVKESGKRVSGEVLDFINLQTKGHRTAVGAGGKPELDYKGNTITIPGKIIGFNGISADDQYIYTLFSGISQKDFIWENAEENYKLQIYDKQGKPVCQYIFDSSCRLSPERAYLLLMNWNNCTLFNPFDIKFHITN